MDTTRHRLSFCVLLCLAGLPLAAQQAGQTVLINADCYQNFSFNAAGAGATIDNTTSQCYEWTVSYNATSGISAVSLAVQGAPNNSGTPGSWGNFQGQVGGTLVTGSNPNTAVQATSTFTGALPYVRVNLASITGSGTVRGVLYGFKNGGAAGGGGGGGGASCPSGTPCIVIGPTATGSAPSTAPVYVAGRDGNGNVYPPIACTLSAPISASASGNTQIVAASSGKVIYVCHWDFTPTTSGNSVGLTLEQGTGSNCATGTAALTGKLANVVALAMDYWTGPIATSASGAVCINLDASVAGTGTILYAQF
jgi:hypothetical protein